MSILTKKIFEDRMEVMKKLLKELPLSEVKVEFEKQTGVRIGSSTWLQIYPIHEANWSYSTSSFIIELQKKSWWDKYQKKIEKQIAQEVADFIYEHWKKEQKNEQD